MRETLRDFVIAVGVGAALLAAGVGLWNAYQFAVLAGRVEAVERAQDSHVNAPGLHSVR